MQKTTIEKPRGTRPYTFNPINLLGHRVFVGKLSQFRNFGISKNAIMVNFTIHIAKSNLDLRPYASWFSENILVIVLLLLSRRNCIIKPVHYIQCPLYQPQSNIKTLITGNLLFYQVSQHYCSASEQQKAKFKLLQFR